MNTQVIQVLQIVVSILLIISILLQNRGAGLGASFGGGGEIYRTKRGAEKFLFRSTIVLIAIFMALALAGLFSQK
jgi:preprotein translocase subunit SecG